MKQVIIINGSGSVGKDEVCKYFGAHYEVMNTSSIDPSKMAAEILGWDGIEKSDKTRKFLSDIKALSIAYNDGPFQKTIKDFETFMADDNRELLFIHIREADEIAKVKNRITSAITLLIKRKAVDNRVYGNISDDNVDDYDYDFIWHNNDALDISMTNLVNEFSKKYLKAGE